MSDVVVIGSLNIDLVVRVEKFPEPGETIAGSDLQIIPGGKGANQAAAISRLGKSVTMIGRVGRDDFGKQLIDNLALFNVDVCGIQRDATRPTGSALITVDSQGENWIVISPGANAQVDGEDIDQHLSIIRNAGYLLLQFEIPLESVIHAARVAKGFGTKIIVNPAPFMPIPPTLMKEIDVLILNEVEASSLLAREIRDIQSALEAIRLVPPLGPQAVVITLGGDGCVVSDGREVKHIPPYQVPVVDSTAAGDAFIGGFVSGLLDKLSISAAAKFGNTCGALTVTKAGAQTSLPSLNEVRAFLDDFPMSSDKGVSIEEDRRSQ